MTTIIIGSDHAGYELKEYIKITIIENGYKLKDMGCFGESKCDYPDIAKKVCTELIYNKKFIGILICGTGIGMSMKANRYSHIRCGVCHNKYTAEMTRKHNDANVLALGSRVVDKKSASNFAVFDPAFHPEV